MFPYYLLFIHNSYWTAEEGADGAQDDFSESFAFALVNGALGVFEVQGRRIRDFRYLFGFSFIPLLHFHLSCLKQIKWTYLTVHLVVFLDFGSEGGIYSVFPMCISQNSIELLLSFLSSSCFMPIFLLFEQNINMHLLLTHFYHRVLWILTVFCHQLLCITFQLLVFYLTFQ